jgi:hypothetical protein
MKYLDIKEGSLEEASYKAINEKPDSSSMPKEIKEEVKKDNPISTEDNFETNLQEMAIVMEAEGDKEEYEKIFRDALKKFGVDSPADFKSDEEKKKFFDYVDSQHKSDKEEEKDLEEKLNDNVDETLDKIREANVEKQKSMRSILADIWNMNEGKNPFEKSKKEEDKSSKKTLTGKKPTAVEIEPKVK